MFIRKYRATLTDEAIELAARVLSGHEWVAPFRQGSYLGGVTAPDHICLPDDDTNAIYIAGQKPWTQFPTKDDGILWVGGNLKDSSCIFLRVRDFVIESHGFFCGRNDRSIGGKKAFDWFCKHGVRPSDLYIGWAVNVLCRRCAERNAILALDPILNENAPARCPIHTGACSY
jgi:hypothetical protein